MLSKLHAVLLFVGFGCCGSCAAFSIGVLHKQGLWCQTQTEVPFNLKKKEVTTSTLSRDADKHGLRFQG